jgi:hypothetical protein
MIPPTEKERTNMDVNDVRLVFNLVLTAAIAAGNIAFMLIIRFHR